MFSGLQLTLLQLISKNKIKKLFKFIIRIYKNFFYDFLRNRPQLEINKIYCGDLKKKYEKSENSNKLLKRKIKLVNNDVKLYVQVCFITDFFTV